MSETVHIDWKHILSQVLVSVRPSNFVYAKNTQNYREYRVARANVYLNEAATGHCLPVTVDRSPATSRTGKNNVVTAAADWVKTTSQNGDNESL